MNSLKTLRDKASYRSLCSHKNTRKEAKESLVVLTVVVEEEVDDDDDDYDG